MEDWSGYTLTYNGSMVAMFNSIYATAPFQQPGAYYYQPTRNWAFDLNFNNPSRLPPLTPRVLYVSRGQWTFVSPNTTSF